MRAKTFYKMYILDLFSRIPWIILGAFIAAISLEVILIPYGLIDGGITGVSMMLSETLGISLSVLLFILNIPFIYLGYKHLGKRFAVSTMLGIITLTVSTGILKVFPPFLFGNSILVIFIGAVLLGLGIGIVIRHGGALDGTDVLAILISHRTSYSVGESIFIINIIIFIFAFLLFGLIGAMISVITYFIATIVVDMVRT
ncbi:YitT family protein [Lysinibacillus fusiformis]|nr:YitT family protein [Lysinibacillus fusiformis]